MKKFILIFGVIALLFVSCEDEEDRPISPLPMELSDTGWRTRAARLVGEENWREFNYISIWAGREYYTVEQGDGFRSEGSFNWYMEGGVQKLKLQSDDRDFDLEFDIVRYDRNHIIARINWGSNYEEWIFYNIQENMSGLVLDKNTSEPLRNVHLFLKANDDIVSTLRSDEYGYFGFERYDFDNQGVGEINKLHFATEGYEDVSQFAGFGQFYFIKMQEGESGLNFATISGRVIDEKSQQGIANAEVSFGDDENAVSTDSYGNYEIRVPVGSTELIATADGYDAISNPLDLEGMQEYTIDFTMPLAGVALGGSISVIGGGSVQGANMELTNENEEVVESLTADVNGNFNFEGVPDGLYVVSASLGGMQFIPSEQFVQVSGNDITQVHFFAMATGKTGLGGQVTLWNDDETPVEGVQVSCGSYSYTTGADGYYLMELDETGSKIVKGEKSGFIDRYKEVNIYDGNLVQQNLSLATFDEGVPFKITGRVTADGNPVEGAVVRVPNNEQTTSDANGEYELTITVYDESIIQYVEIVCEKSGYESGSVILSFYREIPATFDFWLSPE